MISEELKALIGKYYDPQVMRFFDGATEEQITAFETEHGITLPTKYKEWLKQSDGGYLFLPAGIQLYGVEHKPVIKAGDPYWPDDCYIVIGTLATGDPVICEKTGERVSIYNLEAGRIESDETYQDFFDFLGDLDGILGIGG